MVASQFQRIALVLSLSLLFALSACSRGRMTVRETHYFAVPNGENTNYYRLRVKAETKLGEAEYRSGWFPSRSLDMLFGDVSSTGGAAALQVQSQLQAQINEKILATNQAWLDEAEKHNANSDKLGQLLLARRRVLAYPSGKEAPYSGAFEIEYNPGLGIAIRYSDEKLVFLLTSNPDEVISRIASFTEDEKTVLAIEQLSQVIAQRTRNDIAAQGAKAEVNHRIDSLIVAQIDEALKVIESPSIKKEDALREIEVLLYLLESVQP